MARRASRTGGGYLMLRSLEIENFRGYENLRLVGLRRVNVVTGPNAAGKTALLEAVHIAARATPHSIAQVNLARGLAVPNLPTVMPFQITYNPATFRQLWDNLFHNFDNTITIVLKYTDTNRVKHDVHLSYAKGATQAILMGSEAPVVPFQIGRKKNAKPLKIISLTLNAQGQITQDVTNEPLGPNSYFFPANTVYNEGDNVAWFTLLSQENKEDQLINVVHSEFDFINNIVMLSPNQATALWADLGTSKMSLNLVSGGVHKFVALISASLSSKKTLIVIDEIENGIFHERYESFWRALYDVNKANDNQLFISTHSLECLKALAPIAKTKPQDFCLLRTRRQEGKLVVRQIGGDLLIPALSGKGELR